MPAPAIAVRAENDCVHLETPSPDLYGPTPVASPLRQRKHRLFRDGKPTENFNASVHAWLREELPVVEHNKPAAFAPLRIAIDLELDNLEAAGQSRAEARRTLLSNLTTLMFGNDISGHLSQRLSAANINPAGFRTTLAQGVAKNTGENFINAIAYVLSEHLTGQDDVLVDKGLPAPLRPFLTMMRAFEGSKSGERRLQLVVESDVAIWRKEHPAQAIIVSAKTRLKEIFHIATMWKLLYDMLGDPYCLAKWGIEGPVEPPEMVYVFATADMIPAGGTNTQGPDVEREEVRNLISADASFFDYVFVSKTGIGHVSAELDLTVGREALFHELGCLLDLVEQKLDA
jgi:hypothetical protein